jgi:hypothetical protein
LCANELEIGAEDNGTFHANRDRAGDFLAGGHQMTVFSDVLRILQAVIV